MFIEVDGYIAKESQLPIGDLHFNQCHRNGFLGFGNQEFAGQELQHLFRMTLALQNM